LHQKTIPILNTLSFIEIAQYFLAKVVFTDRHQTSDGQHTEQITSALAKWNTYRREVSKFRILGSPGNYCPVIPWGAIAT